MNHNSISLVENTLLVEIKSINNFPIEMLRQKIKDVDDSLIFLDSGGGDLQKSIEIHNDLKNYKAHKTVYIRRADSGASVIALSGNRIKMYVNGLFYIHEAQVIAVGGISDLLRHAEALERSEKIMRGIYAERTGMSDEAIKKMLVDGGTRLSAEEALKLKFIDEIIPHEITLSNNSKSYDTEIFNHQCARCAFLSLKKETNQNE